MFNKIFQTKYFNWEELETKIEKITNKKEKGDVFEEFVYTYLNLKKDFYEIKSVFMEKDIPSDIKKKIRLEKKDNGVDGVFILKNDEIVAYQAKFRSKRERPKYRELATFWAESEYADLRCIIANCNKLPEISNKKNNQFTILVDSFEELEDSFFNNLYNFTNDKELMKAEKYKPRDYQKDIVDDVVKGFQQENRGKLIAACGTGKTLIGLWIAEKLISKKVLFVVPNLSLIKQTLELWKEQAEDPFSSLCVCSDKTVIDKDFYDEFDSDTQDINFPVTTNPEKIKDFLNSDINLRKVIFSTYQSLEAIVYSQLDTREKGFDLAIFDEAHRTAGSKNSELFVYGLEDVHIPINKRLFMTATERIVSPRVKKAVSETEYEIFSMDDKEKYGKSFHVLTFGEAIRKKIISDYKIILGSIDESDNDTLKNIKKNYYIMDDIENITTSQNLFKQILLAKFMENFNINKVITFHTYVDYAKKFVFGKNGYQLNFSDILENVCRNIHKEDVYINHVNGTIGSGERKKIFDEFKKSDYGVLSNSRCLTEGVDIPIINGVYFVDPKESMIDIIQAIGRCLRKKETEEKTSYIIIPLIIPKEIQNFEDINPESFETLHNVLQALRDQDEELSEMIDEVNHQAVRGRINSSKNALSKKIILPKNINIESFAEKLSLRIAEVNKNPTNLSNNFRIIGQESCRRTSGVKRNFRTIADYNPGTLNSSLVKPTLKKYNKESDSKTGKELKINNNNISHTKRLGVIVEDSKKSFKLTEIGKILYHDENKYMDIFKEQILKYYEYNKEKDNFVFPYRAFLKVFLKLDEITLFEFLYSLYLLEDTSKANVNMVVNRILYLRDTYPNIEIIGDNNKKRILLLINKKFSADFKYKDIWTKRTTTYNQYNYFRKHLECFEGIFSEGNYGSFYLKSGGRNKIERLLKSTSIIEIEAQNHNIPIVENLYRKKIIKNFSGLA